MTALPPSAIGISLGDPAGIGPEIVAKALALRRDQDLIVFGDEGVLERAAMAAGVEPPPKARVQTVTNFSPGVVMAGWPNDASGRAQVEYLDAATDAALTGKIVALVTAPISKEWAARAGFSFPGHTEYLAHRAGVTEFAMMLAGPTLRVTLATTHVSLREVPEALTVSRVESAIILTAAALRADFGLENARVAVAGLNPHGGEAGKFGDEETRICLPAIELAKRRLADAGVTCVVSGPHVPDVVFRRAAAGEFDGVVALYHDQGLIPIKLLHFDDAVNLTLGLPFVRTSPDHGTAYDIAGTGRARPTSFLAALDLAATLANRRRHKD